MHGTWVQRWLAFMLLASPAAALWVWGMVGGIPRPEVSAALVSTHSNMPARALLGVSRIRTMEGPPGCDEGWGCNDAR